MNYLTIAQEAIKLSNLLRVRIKTAKKIAVILLVSCFSVLQSNAVDETILLISCTTEIIIIEGDILRVDLGSENVKKIEFFDINENLVLENRVPYSSQVEMNFSKLSSGKYQVKVYSSDGQIHKKWFVKT